MMMLYMMAILLLPVEGKWSTARKLAACSPDLLDTWCERLLAWQCPSTPG